MAENDFGCCGGPKIKVCEGLSLIGDGRYLEQVQHVFCTGCSAGWGRGVRVWCGSDVSGGGVPTPLTPSSIASPPALEAMTTLNMVAPQLFSYKRYHVTGST
jgi:hypothetical protein